jgi:uncharacterized protein
MTLELFGALGIGLLGSLHCLGMCGPLVLAYSLHLDPASVPGGTRPSGLFSRGFSHHLVFHAGRILTYALIAGFAAGLLGSADLNRLFGNLRPILTVAGGTAMLLFGLALLRFIPIPFSTLERGNSSSLFSRAVKPLFASGSLLSKGLLGLATGCLPCMLSWAMIVSAATTMNPVTAFFTMILFGLGTFPVLFLAGFSASFITMRTRLGGERLAAVAVIAMGLILLFKGVKHLV